MCRRDARAEFEENYKKIASQGQARSRMTWNSRWKLTNMDDGHGEKLKGKCTQEVNKFGSGRLRKGSVVKAERWIEYHREEN